jgi:hypothetical protein
MANKLYSYPDEDKVYEFETLAELLDTEYIKFYSENPFAQSVRYAIHETFEFEQWYPPYDYMLMAEVTISENDGDRIVKYRTVQYAIGRLQHDIPELPRTVDRKWIKMWINKLEQNGGLWHLNTRIGTTRGKATMRPMFRSELNKLVDEYVDEQVQRLHRKI